MKTTDDLYNLIKSLTRSEKGYFKKFSQRHSITGNSNYLKLFDEYEKQVFNNIYDEQAIKSRFENSRLYRNFSITKSYLLETILRSLNSYYSGSNKDNEVKENIRSIEILYRKALYPQCLKLFKRTKAEAVKYDNFTQQLELVKWERNLIHERAYPGKTYENLERTYQEEKEILSKIQNVNDYRMMSYRIYNIIGKQQEPVSAKVLLNNSLLRKEENALSYPAKINFHHIRAAIFEAAGESEDAYNERRETIEIMEKFPQKIKENRINYLICLYNLTNDCYNLKLYDKFSEYLNKIRSIPYITSKQISENMRVLMFIGPSTLNLRMLINKGEFEKGVEEAEEIRKNMDKYEDKINPADKFTCIYYMAYTYWGAGNYEEALFWLNKILNEKKEFPETTVSAMILNMIVHFELKNYELLEYLIKSVYRRLRKQKTPNEFEKELIWFLKKTADAVSAMELTDIFNEEKERIAKLKDKKYNEYFDFESWLESKITGRKFAGIVKEKYLHSLN